MPFYFFIFMPVIIIVLPILAALGIPIKSVLIMAGILLILLTIITKWICEGAKASYVWCLLPAGLAFLCFLTGSLIGDDLNLMAIIQNII